MKSWRVVILAFLLANPVIAEDHPFTIEQVMSAPFASDLTASPSGGKIAWVFNEKGARNIWIAEPPEYRGRRLTAYHDDDGQEIAGLDWSADGKNLVYSRGGEDLGGADPNPLSKPNVPEQTIWLVSLEKGNPVSLGQGRAPRISPKGERVVFIKGGQVWWAPLSGKEKAQQLLHTRGTCHSLSWSPDGSRLAFVSDRTGHAFIGAYDWEAKKIRWLDPSVDEDSSPIWSPDGKEIAFLRTPPDHALPFTPKRTGEPWSIRIADATTGKGRQVWRASDGVGSVFHPLNSEHQLWWGADNHLVFPWEKDGWAHLYSVATQGGEATILTPGSFEVEFASLSQDRNTMVYASNQDDIDRRHV
jgi:Tol biopolymer transport system component